MQIVIKKNGRIVDSSITASKLLEKLARTTDYHTLEHLDFAKSKKNKKILQLLVVS